jgi:two-component system, OmpR family, response regulator PhoP
MKILLVEDEEKLRGQLLEVLQANHYRVDTAQDGKEALHLGLNYPYDLAIVDIGLPLMNGVDVIKHWRADNIQFPIIILTARGNWSDKVEGLDAGADDYLVKPFHVEELLSRIKAQLRRSMGHTKAVIGFANHTLSLDLSGKSVTLNNQVLELTAYEYNTLEYLVLNRGKAISKTELTEYLYEQDFDRDSNVIEVFVGRLRKKIDPNGDLKPICTVRGLGYRFELISDESLSNKSGLHD